MKKKWEINEDDDWEMAWEMLKEEMEEEEEEEIEEKIDNNLSTKFLEISTGKEYDEQQCLTITYAVLQPMWKQTIQTIEKQISIIYKKKQLTMTSDIEETAVDSPHFLQSIVPDIEHILHNLSPLCKILLQIPSSRLTYDYLTSHILYAYSPFEDVFNASYYIAGNRVIYPTRLNLYALFLMTLEAEILLEELEKYELSSSVFFQGWYKALLETAENIQIQEIVFTQQLLTPYHTDNIQTKIVKEQLYKGNIIYYPFFWYALAPYTPLVYPALTDTLYTYTHSLLTHFHLSPSLPLWQYIPPQVLIIAASMLALIDVQAIPKELTYLVFL